MVKVWPVDEIFPVPNRDKVATGERDLQRERERRREREPASCASSRPNYRYVRLGREQFAPERRRRGRQWRQPLHG